ncbi:type I restriction endonuclease subunit R [Deinococcus lacus]|uniref:Type I restriction enzyme endonuclease subunit n=1 Tax=Deinococcus lacus TaxID=392561 RepID=A0ABW1YCR0_9DEIO
MPATSSAAPNFSEMTSSQLPALGLLAQMGYTYLTPDEALAARGGRRGQVVLREVLLPALERINRVRYRGRELDFTPEGLEAAAGKLLSLPYTSHVETARAAYDLLTLGTTVEQTIDGDRKSYSVRFIDWERPENNVWHVTEEFTVECLGSRETKRPDVVVFCNGIPLAVIECKSAQIGVEEAVSQHLRNQKPDGIPQLFPFAQILLAVAQNAGEYGTGGTPKNHWARWREEDEAFASALPALVSAPLPPEVKARVLGWHAPHERRWLESGWRDGGRVVSPQDELLHSLLWPTRLLSLIRGYIVFDAGVKKVARYQQFFAVEKTARTVQEYQSGGARQGGVIWHTTGSGKSLTMVMLARAITRLPEVVAPKIVLVTDRIDLDDQIHGTFVGTDSPAQRAQSGNHLLSLLRSGRTQVITTIIDKFEAVAGAGFRDDSADIFLLIDESHRSQYGATHALMRSVLPNACLIGFTGTPLLKREKSTAQKFGGILHAYPMQQAVNDSAVTPLKYEARHAELRGAQDVLDRWFDRVTEGLSEGEKADIKKKFHLSQAVLGAGSRIEEIAYDISQHYAKNYQDDRGLKAQLAVSSKLDAVRYLRAFERWGKVQAALVISAPDTREGHDTVEEASTPEVQLFWKDMMSKHGSPEAYQTDIIKSFKGEGGVELLIVVDKLLTGFDAPRNAVLYLDKRLKEHNILQAIARVNRLYDGKDYGLVVDYRGIFSELKEATDLYAALANEGFDPADVVGMLESVDEEISLLPTRHSHVWDVFAGVDRGDGEAMQLHLYPQDTRDRFYETLTSFAKTLQLALATPSFYTSSDEKTRAMYLRDLRSFLDLRGAVKRRYGEEVDHSAIEAQLQKLIQEHVGAEAVRQLKEPVSIFDRAELEAELDGMDGAARADAIASRITRAISERLESDPTFYKRLSELVNEAIADHRAERLSDLEYLQKTEELAEQIRAHGTEEEDPRLAGRDAARAYLGLLRGDIGSLIPDEDALVGAALAFDDAIERLKVRDWWSSTPVKNAMQLEMDDILYDLGGKFGVRIPSPVATTLFEKVLSVARHRDGG